jgi:hypothetical protein
MSVKQVVLAAALACAFFAPKASSRIVCNNALDEDCCDGHDDEICSFKMLGIDFIGDCIDGSVSLLI